MLFWPYSGCFKWPKKDKKALTGLEALESANVLPVRLKITQEN